jgi:hypothetical protein
LIQRHSTSLIGFSVDLAAVNQQADCQLEPFAASDGSTDRQVESFAASGFSDLHAAHDLETTVPAEATDGDKSLCYQIPTLVREGVDALQVTNAR